MAIAKLGSIFSEVSGSIGGLITQMSAAGQTLRTKVGKINKLNSSTQTPRIHIGYLAQLWAGLTAVQRNNWNSFAIFAQQKMHRNKGMNISGMQIFYQINHFRMMYNIATISDPVFDATLPLPFNVTLPLTFPGIAFDPGRIMNAATEIIYLYMTPPLRLGCHNFENKLRLIKIVTQSATHIHFNTDYMNVFGFYPIAGQTVGVKATFANLATGLMLPYQRSIITLV